MITVEPFPSKPMIAFPESNSWMALDKFFQRFHQCIIVFLYLPVAKDGTWQLDQFTGLTNTELLFYQFLYRLPFIVRPPNFFSSTFLMASFSSVRLATIGFKRLFFSYRSFNRFTSLASIPTYLAF